VLRLMLCAAIWFTPAVLKRERNLSPTLFICSRTKIR
jgi:hypothetical protein